MAAARFYATLNIIFRGHIFNWFWRPKEKRRAVRYKVISDVIPKYLERYLPAAAKIKERKVVKNDKKEKIFSIWLQGEENAPALVKACFRNIRKHCKQELVVLDEKTLFKYITLPDYILEKRKNGLIKNAHFADICRVELLYEYGGIWLDATDFVTSDIPQWIIDEDFFVYLVGKNGAFSYSFMQNCFIRSRKGALLLDAWRAMIFDYWKHENGSIDYFVHQLLFKTLVTNDERAKKYFDKMPHVDQDPTHALWWGYHNKPFDKKKFKELTSYSFFQKTTYDQAKNPIPGSFADVMINM